MKRLLTVTLLIALASNLCLAQQPAYEFPLSGSQMYRLRWGQQEGSADLVPFPPVLGQPICAQKGSTLQLGVRWTRNMDVFWGGCRYGWCSVARAQGR